MGLFDWLIILGGGLVLLLIIVILMTTLYRRATKETAFVRTGFGGEKVVMNGGALVFPVFHETMPVNMNTLVLSVIRRDTEALITLDRLRIDVKAEFYVRVRPDSGAIAMAAEGSGRRQVRRCAAFGRGRNEHERTARTARRLRPEGAAGFIERPRDERTRA